MSDYKIAPSPEGLELLVDILMNPPELMFFSFDNFCIHYSDDSVVGGLGLFALRLMMVEGVSNSGLVEEYMSRRHYYKTDVDQSILVDYGFSAHEASKLTWPTEGFDPTEVDYLCENITARHMATLLRAYMETGHILWNELIDAVLEERHDA